MKEKSEEIQKLNLHVYTYTTETLQNQLTQLTADTKCKQFIDICGFLKLQKMLMTSSRRNESFDDSKWSFLFSKLCKKLSGVFWKWRPIIVSNSEHDFWKDWVQENVQQTIQFYHGNTWDESFPYSSLAGTFQKV